MDYVALGIEGIKGGLRFCLRFPHLLLLGITQSLQKRLLLPIDVVRFLIKANLASHPSLPLKKIQIFSDFKGLRTRLSIELMETLLHLEGTLTFRGVKWSPEQFLLSVEVSNISVQAPETSPLASMISSIDLSNVEALLPWLSSTPAYLVGIKKNVITLDLFKLPLKGRWTKLTRIFGALSFVLSVSKIRVGSQVIVIQFKTHLEGLRAALRFLSPS